MRIKNFCRFTTAVFFTAICGSGAASDVLCERVAQETLMELKAGAADWWTEDTARMAGMAAARTCNESICCSSVSRVVCRIFLRSATYSALGSRQSL